MSNEHLTTIRFDSLPLQKEVLQGIERTGFSWCTPIQAQTLPLALAGRDIAGQAQTGTGKTAAFLIALYNYLLTHPASSERRANQPRALVIAPTRELAIQIHNDALAIGAETGLSLGLVYGGTAYEKQRDTLAAGVDVLIGTPGRLIDYFKQRIYDLRALQVMVLDEADRMFDLGFIKDIRYLMRHMPHPEKRLSLLFSATLALRVTELAYEHMNNPQLIEVKPEQVTAEKVVQTVYFPAMNEKIPLLLGLLDKLQPQRSIVFVNTKRVADKVWGFLEGNGYKTAILSGDVPQTKRQSLLKLFTDGEFPVLVATDVAARGLHISNVSHVFNYDLPQEAEDYVHRIGRTARAGESGTAISFACEEYAYSLMDIEAYIGSKIQVEGVAQGLLKEPLPPVKGSQSRPQGKRKPGGQGASRRGPSGQHGRRKPQGSKSQA